MSEEFRHSLSGEPLNDAALWHQRLSRRDADEPIWVAFTEWLEADERHRAAYDRIEALYGELDGLDAAQITLFRNSRRRRILWGAGSVVTLIAASVLVAMIAHPDPPIIERVMTAPGETRHILAADGSAFDLNGGTSIEITLSSGERQVRLDRGEALFHVAVDPRRPFHVLAGRWEIRDIGTIFDVVQTDGLTRVSVEQGKVSVSASDGAVQPVFLSAGGQFEQRESGDATLRSVDPKAVASWTNGYLIYDDAPLSAVVADVSRYGPRQVVLQGADSSFRRFSGILKIDSQEAMLARLGQFMPLFVDRAGDGPISVRTASPAK